ncbi:MAG: thioesterase family protein [Sandaracinus sp.]|nr:thioesterase family protein [Sandaracinus sp.]MCB9604689.1 thioesterase family protein [Sandaracinus sp.]MCB9613445.1 thioesterase family protein [Sandaracinus sp.]
MQYRFDEHVAVEPVGDGSYRATVRGEWNIGKVPNGGYQSAICANAALHALGARDVLNVTSYYLTATAPGPAILRVEVVKAGRTTSLAQVGLWQEDRERVRTLVLCGDLDAFEGADHHESGPPELAAPEDCPRLSPDIPVAPRLLHEVEARVDPSTAGFTKGETGNVPELRAWMRFTDGRATDTVALACFADVLPPTSFNLLGVTGWVPTLELTTQIRRRPVPGWIRARIVTRHFSRGHFEEDGELWDEAGNLVAVSRQRAMLLTR